MNPILYNVLNPAFTKVNKLFVLTKSWFLQNLIEQIHVTISNIKKINDIKSRAWTCVGDLCNIFVCHALSKAYFANWDNPMKIPHCNFNKSLTSNDNGEERSRSLSLATITSFFPFKESHKDWYRTV